MAKKKKSAKRAAARRVVVYRAAPKKKRRPVSRHKAAPKKRRPTSKRIGAMKSKPMSLVLGAVMTGAGIYLGNLAGAYVPGSRTVAGGAVAAGGIALGMVGLPKELSNGVAGAGLVQLAQSMLQPGVTGGVGFRRRLTAADRAAIEAAAGSDAMNGLTAETLHGRTPVRPKVELF